jgi:hypothetical protein
VAVDLDTTDERPVGAAFVFDDVRVALAMQAGVAPAHAVVG